MDNVPSQKCKIAKAQSDNGTRCSRPAFIRAAGRIQTGIDLRRRPQWIRLRASAQTICI